MKHAREDYQKRIIDVDNIIPEDEPVFLLRGQDKFAAQTVAYYASLVRKENEELAKKAIAHANEMEAWKVKKSPDCPEPVAEEPEEGAEEEPEEGAEEDAKEE